MKTHRQTDRWRQKQNIYIWNLCILSWIKTHNGWKIYVKIKLKNLLVTWLLVDVAVVDTVDRVQICHYLILKVLKLVPVWQSYNSWENKEKIFNWHI